MSQDFRTGRHVVYNLHAHIILTPKYRKRVITARVQDLIKTITLEVCERNNTTLDAIDGTDDHIHLLISYPPKIALSEIVRSIKTNTSRHLRKQQWAEITQAFWGNHFWSPSYCVISTGDASIDIVRAYIEGQQTATRGPGRPKR